MAITPNDVKLLKSELMTDAADSGGRATGTAIVDNEMNNMFPDISRLDRTTGRINLRKVFAGVVTANNDPYLGAHAILTEPPADPKVSVLLFNTESQTDVRTAAQSAIESYMAPSSAASFELLGNQLLGQRSIVGVQRDSQRIPTVGEVFQLVNGATTQYIRVTDVESSLEEFVYEYSAGSWTTFTRRRIVMELSAPLNYTFPGGSPTPSGTSATSPTSGQAKSQVLATTVADAARYYGIHPLAVAASNGDMTVKVDSIYSQLVPSTTKESPLLSLLAGNSRTQVAESGSATSSSLTFSATTGSTSHSFLGFGVARGSLNLTINGGVYKDDSTGALAFVSGTNWMTAGEVDYETGEITVTRTGTAYTGAATAAYTPGTTFIGQTLSDYIKITVSNRGYVYTLNLAGVLPRPGTFVVSYMALGKWYDLLDNGRGEISGDGAGTGTIDYATGAVSLTFSALPDIDSNVLYSYTSTADTAMVKVTGSVTSPLKIQHTLPHTGIKPSSVSISWTSGGVAKTATDNGTGGLSGNATGTVNYATGEIEMRVTTTPDSAAGINFSYEQGSINSDILSGLSADGTGYSTFTIPGAPLKPGSVSLSFVVTREGRVPSTVDTSGGTTTTTDISRTVVDDGAGGWKDAAGAVPGTINYTTGDCYVLVARSYTYTKYYYRTITFVVAGG